MYEKERDMNLAELATNYAQLKSTRSALEKKVDELKTLEDSYKDNILNEMASLGMKSVNLLGVGTVVSKTTDHYEIVDIELLAKKQLEFMEQALENGTPLAETFFLQRRITKERLTTVLEEMGVQDPTMYGVKLVQKNTLTLTQTKN